MFDEIRKCLDEYEEVHKKIGYPLTKEEIDAIQFFDLHIAEAIMKNKNFKDQGEQIAKIILAYLGVSNEIKIKIE